MPYKVFVAGQSFTATEANDYLMRQSVMVFPDAAARDAALVTKAVGMVTYLTGVRRLESYNGTYWIATQTGQGVYTSNAGGGADIYYPTPFRAGTIPTVTFSVVTPSGGNNCWGSLHSGSNAVYAHILYLNSVGGSAQLLPNYGLTVHWSATGAVS